ncbi:ComF family protein [Clostridium sp. D2Q-11]|uniref:ComF family protein n=1 Tax=Anaeromonas frigoriresistens TaxID=2683708 RepID=A0A942UYX5_9FIRM|nr:ComF family protein [Anaeromonas frigoriresistens]MBS4538152.1 ComF family protein [Anaeromonas frigoriresistens]
MEIFKVLLNLIYPEENICFICDEYYEEIENHLCNECRNKLPFINHVVQEDVICPLRYEEVVKDIIFKYKYGKNPYLYKVLGNIILEAFESAEIENIDIIVPIPLSRKKKSNRGFNQSELLAKFLSESTKIPMDTKNLLKIKKTKSQSGLTKRARRENIKGAFQVKNSEVFIGKTVLIVDDIFTSGATYNEASKILIEAGAINTYLITIATGRDL